MIKRKMINSALKKTKTYSDYSGIVKFNSRNQIDLDFNDISGRIALFL